ncbi:MAG: heat shock protein HspQ [Verrucomicrobiota bacterium]|jgi:heat shock protein HspQ|nr:heat shock protein HspQ [Verrucomicrobiota bacterium]|tara:strand:+ start:1607 stop:1960 length:354 start_codon:yes stop_codon:yes gene_type:complete
MIMLRADLQDCKPPRFAPGDLVWHVRYHYRGVVVAHDPRCMAGEAWYQSNQTQPDKNQPWHHVLVHDSASVTYPAESSLESDDSGEPISHPLLDQFFSEFADGRYQRNDVYWPRTSS